MAGEPLSLHQSHEYPPHPCCQVGAKGEWLQRLSRLGDGGKYVGNMERDLHRIFAAPETYWWWCEKVVQRRE